MCECMYVSLLKHANWKALAPHNNNTYFSNTFLQLKMVIGYLGFFRMYS